jgi:hypothetical protein
MENINFVTLAAHCVFKVNIVGQGHCYVYYYSIL